MEGLNTAVLFLVFNRPNHTSKVFETIRLAKPKQLFIAADGPRSDRPDENEICRKVRKIAYSVDWDCEVKTLFRETNLGCGLAVSEAITWFFEHVEEGIILEDDCLPNESFYSFCSTLLEKYRNNHQIMHISGNNFQNGIWRGEGSYYFSQFPHIWGWATWKRAWKSYDLELKNFPAFIKNKSISKIVGDKNQAKFWQNSFQLAFSKSIDTWDFAWFFTFFSNNGYAILPNQNLVSNIGFGIDATHTIYQNDKLENLPVFKLKNLIHPLEITLNKKADKHTYNSLFNNNDSTSNKLTRKMKSLIKNMFVSNNLIKIKNILKKIISVTGYSLHFKILKLQKSKILTHKIGSYILHYPSNHQLINILATYPDYSQNIGRLSKIVKDKYSDLYIIDVGANIGDTVIFIRNEINCAILAVEGDAEFYNFLKLNTENIDNVLLAKAFLDEFDHNVFVDINKSRGTLSLSSKGSDEITEFIKLDTLLQKFSSFNNAKILKVDTDGYDIKILKGAADFIAKTKPVIFFEYDVNFYASPKILIDIIKFLEEKGYSKILIYDNFGRFIMQINIIDNSVLQYLTLYIKNNNAIFYYDFCVFHAEDNDLCLKLCKIETIAK